MKGLKKKLLLVPAAGLACLALASCNNSVSATDDSSDEAVTLASQLNAFETAAYFTIPAKGSAVSSSDNWYLYNEKYTANYIVYTSRNGEYVGFEADNQEGVDNWLSFYQKTPRVLKLATYSC